MTLFYNMQLPSMMEIDKNVIAREHCSLRVLRNGYHQGKEPPPRDAPQVRSEETTRLMDLSASNLFLEDRSAPSM